MFTKCNFCLVKKYQHEAEISGRKLTTIPNPIPGFLHAVDIFIHSPEISVERLTHDQWVAWIAHLPDHCVCSI